jgi:hypothetical protein
MDLRFLSAGAAIMSQSGECCVPGGCHGLQNRCCQVILGLVGSIPALSANFFSPENQLVAGI